MFPCPSVEDKSFVRHCTIKEWTAMRELEQRYGIFLGVVLLATLLLALPAPVLALSSGMAVPDNARAKGYGSGCECTAPSGNNAMNAHRRDEYEAAI